MDCATTVTAVHDMPWMSVLSLFFGGVVGAAGVLGLERYLDHRKNERGRTSITNALEEEINRCLSDCDQFIISFTQNPTGINYMPEMPTYWMDKYVEKCIDYTSDDSKRLYSFIRAAKAYVGQIAHIEQSLHTYTATSRALVSYQDGIRGYNALIAGRVSTLQSVLYAIKRHRVGNGITREAVLADC